MLNLLRRLLLTMSTCQYSRLLNIILSNYHCVKMRFSDSQTAKIDNAHILD